MDKNTGYGNTEIKKRSYEEKDEPDGLVQVA
jgi:hypothetical protein